MVIEIFALSIDNIEKVERLGNIKHVISEKKMSKIKQFYFEKDKIRGIVGEALIRYLLIKMYNIRNSDIRFGYSERGKPYLLYPECNICFNISHSGSWVVCGIGTSKVGIDVEQIRDKEIKCANYVLTKQEYNYWLSLSGDEQRNNFYRLWTLKESYSKYLGVGLSLKFSDIMVCAARSGHYFVNEKEDCILFSQQFKEEYYLAICVDNDENINLISQVAYIDKNDMFEVLLST